MTKKELCSKFIDFLKIDKATLIIIVFILSFKSFGYNPSFVPTGSMIPTIDAKSLIVVNVHEYGIKIPFTKITLIENNTPNRGDIAVFRYPVDESINYVKRIVALPGDTVFFNEKEYFLNSIPNNVNVTDYKKTIVPSDKYFAIGDNINHSYDSRFWGFVPKENLVGKYSFTVFELNKILDKIF